MQIDITNLPHGEYKKALEFPHFPTRLQAVVWRNWGLVKVEQLAKVLNASVTQIGELAADMGLQRDDSLVSLWRERGYLTIIRRNWHLLPYEQILALLDWAPEKLAYVLKEDDFLWVKLGMLKPETKPVYYAPLSDEEKQQTVIIRNTISGYFSGDDESIDPPFGFLRRYGNNLKLSNSKGKLDMRMTYSYSAVYGDPLLNEKLAPYPDDLLKDYASAGITTIWLQGTLYTLVPWFGDSKYSDGWQIRLFNLGKLCRSAAKHGIKVYLYLNEPRSMPPEFFEKHPDWRGAMTADGLSFTLCTSRKVVLEALKNGISELFRQTPELGGIFTVTMSENLTHCFSRPQDIVEPCPHCSTREISEIVAEINRTLAEGVHQVKPEADVIVSTWAWSSEWDEQVIELLPKDVKLMCVSETGVPTNAMGIEGSVLDFSISKIGPGPTASRLWKKAQQCNLDTVAKVQLNNTWECSAVPYIPVPGLVEQHLRNLEQAGIKNYNLSWTLGGYPGGNFELLQMPKDKLAEKKYGMAAAPLILQAWEHFDHAFTEFPLNSLDQLYTAPQNFGPMNLLFTHSTGYTATMLGFPYDDIATWRGNHYPENILEEQFRKLSEGWAEGLKILTHAKEKVSANKQHNFNDLFYVSEAIYCHFRSTYLQIRFIRLRDTGNSTAISAVLNEEIALAKRLHEVVQHDSRIGFEASNHYYYTANDLKEKVLNCEHMKKSLCTKLT